MVGVVSRVIPASSAEVFDLLHDYDRRLQWDTLLSAAYLEEGFTQAGLGATSVCIGRRGLRAFALRTIYVSYERPKVAAVKLVNAPPLFARWAASIRHVDLEPGRSRCTYKFSFRAKPAVLRGLIEPVLLRIFTRETARRLEALEGWFNRTAALPQ